jgi:hypothetical protein
VSDAGLAQGMSLCAVLSLAPAVMFDLDPLRRKSQSVKWPLVPPRTTYDELRMRMTRSSVGFNGFVSSILSCFNIYIHKYTHCSYNMREINASSGSVTKKKAMRDLCPNTRPLARKEVEAVKRQPFLPQSVTIILSTFEGCR